MPTKSGGLQIQRLVDPNLIDPNPWQPRKTIDPEKLAELADDIEQRGLLQAIVVRTKDDFRFELAWGQRRLEAVRLLIDEGRRTEGIEARIEELTDEQVILGSLAENNARESVDIIEETRALQQALQIVPGLRATDVAKALGISKGQLSSRRSLLRLPQAVLDQVSSGRIPWTGAREMLTLLGKNCDHPDVIADVLTELDWEESITVMKVRLCVGMVAIDHWEMLDYEPSFDVDEFRKLYPTHRVNIAEPGEEAESVRYTCAVEEFRDWEARARAETAEKAFRDDGKPAHSNGDGPDTAWVEALMRDPVVLKVAPLFSRENPTFTREERESLGTRAEEDPSVVFDWSLDDTKTYNAIPNYFDQTECRTSCIKGAYYARAWLSDQMALRCSNRDCFKGKLSAGFAEAKRVADEVMAEADARQAALADQLTPWIPGPTYALALARALLSGSVTGLAEPSIAPRSHQMKEMLDSEDKRFPLAKQDVCASLGLVPNPATHALWWNDDAKQALDGLDEDEVMIVAYKLLALALDEAGFRL